MKKLLTILLTLCLIATFAACNNTQKDNEGTVLSIEGNPTTGYSWHATNYDAELISVEELGAEQLESSGENMVGVPSVFKFKIVGLKEGTGDLTFEYYRDFEGADYSIDLVTYEVTVDGELNVTAEEKAYQPVEEDLTPSEEMETLVNDLVTASEVQFNMPGTSKVATANAPTFVGLSEDLFTQYVVDSIVYEPMISPATSSMVIVKLSEDANVSDLKQTVIDNCNPRKWICTGAEYCLAIDSGNYILLIMSTEDNCNAMKTAFTEHFGAENVGEALTKVGEIDGDVTDVDMPGFPCFPAF